MTSPPTAPTTFDEAFAVPTYDAVDLCGGPGGWDVAAQRLGLNVLGFEIDEAALRTRDAAGHATATVPVDPTKAHPRGVRGLSMTEVDPRDYLTRGQIASPPCQGFSMAGKGKARADSARLLDELSRVRTRSDLVAMIDACQDWMGHPGTALVLEPLRWAMTNAPSWLAWEQVAPVLPVWEACATILRRLGYSVETGVLTTERYGVPQTRRRAILVARAPWLVAEIGPVSLPTATHSRYHNRTPDRLDEGVARWVSMAEALGWTDDVEVVSNYGTGGDAAARGVRKADEPAATITSKAGRNSVQLATGTRPNANRFNGSTKSRNDGIRLAVEEAATLQTFPDAYPWQGTKGKMFEQIGNAVPPLFAEAVLCAAVGLPFRPALRGD